MQSNEIKRRILVVDDETSILNAVRRELSMPMAGRYSYEVETFTNPVEALERGKAQSFDAVLSDYRMPEMDGLAFLKAFREVQPDCECIVLSGQTDFDALTRMINETHIYRFIPKPWSAYFLKSSLMQAIRFRESNLENRRLADSLRSNGITLPSRTEKEEKILVVDQGGDVIAAVERCLKEYEQREGAGSVGKIGVVSANSAESALKMAVAETFSCVIGDYAMPGMGGADFLVNFSEKQPDCACLIVSAETDMESLITAVDLAHVHAFVTKPFSDYELGQVLAEALSRRRLVLENREYAEVCKQQKLA